ncbi:hypothetical protein AAFF_G00214370 [Aldrovandia affinis]|uniref:Ena/VASP-like protein n=1 Tax=Aldrovandia affinis TaxID=143900 RepID=A0AAD7RGY4_9TELE|nr:hypothetical protein AAFF_G00214370 [Aldrovandia affinis]
MSEQSICQARASVMVYDDTSKKWVPIKPGQQGFSRINIYHNTANNTFRVVGVKLQDQQVVINYSIVKGLKYNQATPTFHQWRDARQVYGLNFASKEEAITFSNAMLFALNVLSSQDGGPPVQRQNGPTTDDMEAQRRQAMEQHQMQTQVEKERRPSNSGPSGLPGYPPALRFGRHAEQAQAQAQAPSGLAAAIASAKLRRVHRPEDSSSGSSAKNDANRTSGTSGGLMEEMNALLARRRKATEKEEESVNEDPHSRGPGQHNATDPVKRPWDRANSADRARVRPVGSSSDTDALDFDRMKQEILEEVVRELHKVKDEIIVAIRQELSRVSTS